MAPRGVIFQCGACRALVSTSALVTTSATTDRAPERAGLACDACGGVTWLPLGAAAASEGERVVDVGVTTEPAPAQLALAAPSMAMTMTVPNAGAMVGAMGGARFSDEQRGGIDERMHKLVASGDVQADLARSFERLLGQWGSEAEHKTVLSKASLAGELAFVGQRYRAVLDVVPGDAPAKKAQGDILALAMASMSLDKGNPIESAGNTKKAMAAAIVIVGLMLAVAVFVYLPSLLGGVLDDGTQLDPQEHGQNVAVPVPGR